MEKRHGRRKPEGQSYLGVTAVVTEQKHTLESLSEPGNKIAVCFLPNGGVRYRCDKPNCNCEGWWNEGD